MKHMLPNILLRSALFFLISAMAVPLCAQPSGTLPPPPPVRAIPGITAGDMFPGGCVDCHLNYTGMHMDTRISTLMEQWTENVDESKLARFQAFSPAGMKLKGKHPPAGNSLKDIPANCMKCHGENSKMAPPFSTLLHGIHLAGGPQSPYMTYFQGECTHCHKFDATNGAWRMPSGAEK